LAALIAVAACLPLALGGVEPGFTLWPGARQWPKEAEVVRGLRMDALWEALRAAPPGRVLFVRSGVKLDWRPEWWRPHTHITALTPLRAGRSILGGTFTHPSPIAGLLYTGSTASRPIRLLAEQRDGVSLFGRPLDALDPQTFDELARRLAVSTVVVPEEDVGRVPFLTENQSFRRSSRIGSFTLFVSRQPAAEPTRIGPQRWRVDTAPATSGWTELSLAYSPLWVARVDGRRIPVRRDGLGLVEVEAPAGSTAVELEHRAGAAERTGVGVSLLSGTAILALGLRRARA
ncbi:MAG TPA: hypothetical protein VJX92_28570, partial [Methylomirabilota bacterium]|nr:hypothetical protein [Methylomirabilota bacterium]